MPTWLWVLVAGGIGGLVNGYFSADGLLLRPRRLKTHNGRPAVDPGTVGNVVIGCVTGFVTWGLYNTSASFGGASTNVPTVVGALLSGVAGGRLLTSYVEKTIAEIGQARIANALAQLTDKLLASEPESQEDAE